MTSRFSARADRMLNRIMHHHARPVTVEPIASQLGAPPYEARGAFSRRHVTVLDGEGVEHSASQLTLGIRMSEFPIAPMQADEITIEGEGRFRVYDTQADSEGHMLLILQELRP